MKVLLIIITLIIFLLFINHFLVKGNKYKLLYLIVPLLFLAFNIALSNVTYTVVGEQAKIYINTATILMLVIFLIFINKNTFRIDYFYFFFVMLAFQISYTYFSNQYIYDLPMFFRLLMNYLTIILTFFIASSLRNVGSQFDTSTYLYCFNYLAILNGVLGFLQVLTGKSLLIGSFNTSILYTQGVVNVNRAVGIAGSNNSGGNLGALLFVITLNNLMSRKDMFSLFSCVITFLFTVLTQTRTAIVVIVLVLFFTFFTQKSVNKNQQFAKVIFTTLLLVSLIIFIFLFGKIMVIKLFIDRGNTAGSRFIQFNNAWSLAMKKHFWIGIGAGQWTDYLYENYKIVDIPIHSQYLNFWVENGFPIFILNVIFNITILVRTLNRKYVNGISGSFIWLFFLANLVVCNFNPNQIYTINNVVYYLTIFILMFKRVSVIDKEVKKNGKEKNN